MGLEEIVKEIIAKGKNEAAKILEEGEAEASRILEEAKNQALKIKAAREEAVKREAARLRQQEISSANLEVKRNILNAKKELLDKAYEKALETLSRLPADKNARTLKSLLEKHGGEGARIYCKESDQPLVTHLTDLMYAGSINCLGGVIFESEDGSVRLDYTYDSLLKNVYEPSLKQISEILFG